MASTSVTSEFLDKSVGKYFVTQSASMGGVDRISSLPDEAARHLLGFLDVGDLSQLLLVSKRWYRLCISVPVLTVDNREHTSGFASYDRYVLVVESYLALRHKAQVEVRKFKLTWQFCWEGEREKTRMKRKREQNDPQSEFDRIQRFYANTFKSCGIESLRLHFISRESQHLHFPVVKDPTYKLKELAVRTQNISFHSPRLPICPYTAFQLESLTLESFKLTHTTIGNLVLLFRKLKRLALLGCIGMKCLIFISGSLEHLMIKSKVVELEYVAVLCARLQYLILKWHPVPRTSPGFPTKSPGFQMYAPQLRGLFWCGFPLGWCNFVHPHLLHLQHAVFYFLLPSGAGPLWKDISAPWDTSAPWDISEASNFLLGAVINQLRMTKCIRLHSNTIELFFIKGISPSPLSNAQSLAIDCCYLTDKEVPAISFFLQGVSHLESLSISSFIPRLGSVENILPSDMKGFDVNYWESQVLKFVPQLKKATIEVWHGGNEVELIKYLLKHATALETLIIRCDPSLVSGVSEQVMGYKSLSTVVRFWSYVNFRPNPEFQIVDNMFFW